MTYGENCFFRTHLALLFSPPPPSLVGWLCAVFRHVCCAGALQKSVLVHRMFTPQQDVNLQKYRIVLRALQQKCRAEGAWCVHLYFNVWFSVSITYLWIVCTISVDLASV